MFDFFYTTGCISARKRTFRKNYSPAAWSNIALKGMHLAPLSTDGSSKSFPESLKQEKMNISRRYVKS
jgi:hypothetical protein